MANLRDGADMPTAITLIRPLRNGRNQTIDIGITFTETAPVYSDVIGGPQ